MKINKKLICLCLMVSLVFQGALSKSATVVAASNPYPTSQNVDGDAYYEIPCTYYAWQQVYNNSGVALPNWGNAVDWWQGAKNAGYSTGSTPKAGAIAVWSGDYYGHVAYVTSGSGNTFTVNEGGRTDLDHTSSHGVATGYTLTNAVGAARPYDPGKTLLGFIYPTKDNRVPDAVTDLRSDKDVYNSSESIRFVWSPSARTKNYWVYLWKNGVQLYQLDCGTNTSYTSAPTSPGDYTLIIRPCNENGANESSKWYKFVVTNNVPEPIKEYNTTKTKYYLGDKVDISWNITYGTEKCWAYLWKDGVQTTYKNMGKNTLYSVTPTETGKYTLVLRPENVNGFCENCTWFRFEVVDKNSETTTEVPQTTKIEETTEEQTTNSELPTINEKPLKPTSVQGVVDKNDNYNLFWMADSSATYYNIYVNGENVGNTVTTSYRIPASFFTSNGEYKVAVEAVNSFGVSERTIISYIVEKEVLTTAEATTKNNSTAETSTSKKTTSVEQTTKKADSKPTYKGKIVVPSKVKGLKLKNIKKKKIKVSWKWKAYGVMSYGWQVQYSRKKNFKNAKIKNVKWNEESVMLKKLSKKKTYYVRVRAWAISGDNVSRYGAWSDVKKCKVKK